MSDASNPAPSGLQQRPPGYAEWLTDLKTRIHAAQQRAALAVNRELLLLYWELGRDILARQVQAGWGAGIVDQVSRDLRATFPDLKGFSRTNLLYMRAFAEAWSEPEIVQQAVGQLPWGHNLVLLTKLKTAEMRLAYAQRAIDHGWSRNVLHAYVVIELKAGDFKPEHTGKLGFYLSAVDAQMKAPEDGPTIGLLLCKSKNHVVAEYALRDTNKPIGVAEYQLIESLPKDLEASLPSIEQIERELGELKE